MLVSTFVSTFPFDFIQLNFLFFFSPLLLLLLLFQEFSLTFLLLMLIYVASNVIGLPGQVSHLSIVFLSFTGHVFSAA